MWNILKSPFLAVVFLMGFVLMAPAAWIGVGLANEWPTYDGMAKGGGVAIAISLGVIGLAMVFLGLKPGWKE